MADVKDKTKKSGYDVPMDAPLLEMRNLGPAMVFHLNQAGITTPDELRKLGPVEAFRRIRTINPKVMGNRMALYAIYGALTDQDCIAIPQETKDWLEAELRKNP